MKLKYVVLVTEGNAERAENVQQMKKQIHSLVAKEANLSNVFEVYRNAFDIEDEYDGVVMLEDDITLCRDFTIRAENAISKHKDDVIQLFRLTEKHGYYSPMQFSSTCCNYFPRHIAKEAAKEENERKFREWYSQHDWIWTYPADYYIRWLLKQMKLKYYVECPYLVQHNPWKSAVGPRSSRRQTPCFIDDMKGDEENVATSVPDRERR